ncbi:MAG: ROK family protein [Christensenellales bacterium]|jgi:predicted NBD/HSP70 family sugar kinase
MQNIQLPLDPGFLPLSLVFEQYREKVHACANPVRFAVRIQREEKLYSSYSMDILPPGRDDAGTLRLLDRLVKSLLWIRGGYRIITSGSVMVHEQLLAAYRAGGARAFDADFMSTVYERPFEVCYESDTDCLTASIENASSIGKHLNGCRIGFDAGGSDRKVSAVMDGKPLFSEEVVWHPKVTADPDYHYQGILSAFRAAAAHLPRVDGIGVSSAGVYIDNKAMVASLFLKVPKELYQSKVKNIYIRAAKEIGDVPLLVANDGDVTALAGAMSLGVGQVLGIAMGTSQAGGYVDEQMRIMGWLNELAFVPVDMNEHAMADEWSGDIGCGVKYFSQDAVIKLAPAAGIDLSAADTPAEKLRIVQREMEADNPKAAEIYRTIGVYFAYAIAWYARFYNISLVLVMGRVSSGKGGGILIEAARDTLNQAFPELAKQITLSLPNEKARRIGQSVAAASLPEIQNA